MYAELVSEGSIPAEYILLLVLPYTDSTLYTLKERVFTLLENTIVLAKLPSKPTETELVTLKESTMSDPL